MEARPRQEMRQAEEVKSTRHMIDMLAAASGVSIENQKLRSDLWDFDRLIPIFE